ncbi:MAG: hypothetical protein PHT07_24215 [Paludibacter sp.]|nr:hypothetical protein [Paludibacter sp.]
MKKTFSTLLLLFLFVSLAVQSQQPNRPGMMRNRIEQAKLREIKERLQLDDTTFTQFRPIYLEYEKKIANINLKHQGKLMRVNADSISAAEAEMLITEQLTSAKRIVVIRESFYMKCRKVLTPQQLVKLYQSEADLRKKVMTEISKRQRGR